MALYRCQTFKTLTGDRFWTNVYHFNVTTIDAAAAFANTVIAPGEATLMDGSFRVVRTLISDPLSDEFVTTPLNIAGAMSGVAYLPLYNTAKVNVSVDGHGRPDYKFYRGGITEANQTNGMIDAGMITAYDDLVNSFIADGTAAGCDLVDDEGNLWLVASTQAAVQMRQLHRKRKKVVVVP